MRVFGSSVLLGVSVVALQSLAVAQTSPPPPDYQQPPPGYQQPPPGYQQPPPGYQQQPPPGYQQQPPPGYQQPPPAGYPPPQAYGSSPPPGYAAPPPQGKHGFLALPYIGIESHQGDSGEALNTGFILGALLGGRINPQFSINGELRFDVLNPKGSPPAGTDETALEFDLAFSPLFHAPLGAGEFVIGPKLGAFAAADTPTYGGTEVQPIGASGYVVGFNTGAFFDVSPGVALGGMISFSIRDATKVCLKYGGVEQCDSTTNYDAEKVLGFHAGALF